MELRFPPLSGGTVSGLNDAGIETFEGDFAANVVRECVQNSLDAAVDHSKPVEVVISWHSVPRGELPFADRLVDVLRSCRSHWQGHAKAQAFFEQAIEAASQLTIDCLRISDSNTTGLDGGDDDLEGRWFGLVKSRGVSNQKESGSGGAFGIGKDAPLAGSLVRTVLYSTRTLAGNVALQGVSRLVTHPDVDTGAATQGTGFIGRFDSAGPRYVALRDTVDIPPHLLRSEPGLDVWILCWRPLDGRWETPFIHSALANFWPAIADRKVRLVIGSESIDHSNLNAWMMREMHNNHVGDAYPYYRAFHDEASVRHETKLPHAGHCRLHLLAGKKDLPRRVCLVRKTGMVIDFYAPRVQYLPFSGLFVCDDDEGNRLLRSLEPPRHDKWDRARGDKTAQLALAELKEWIRETIKRAVPDHDADEFNETAVTPELADMEDNVPLPPVEDGQNEPDLGGSASTTSKPESSQRTPRPAARDSSAEARAPDPEGGGSTNPRNRGDGTRSGGRKKPAGEGDAPRLGKDAVPRVAVRSFITPEDEDVYEVILRTDADHEGCVWIDAVGDNGASEALPLLGAALEDGTALPFDYNKIGPLRFQKDAPLRIGLRFKTPGKFSLRASLS